MKGRKEEGITLIALVITIIVLLILAGVTISLTFGENGILARAKEGKDKYAEAEQNEIDILDNLDNYMSTVLVSEEGYNEEAKVNQPKLAEGMIPVYYDETAEIWKVAQKDNKGENKWYDYDTKQWANIVTVSDENAKLRTAAVDTEIPMEDITTFFVWIPRYAYSINAGYYKTSDEETPTQTNEKKKEGTERIDITFIKGNTNVGIDGTVYPRNYDESKLEAGDKTPKIVHPAFTFGDEELTGIWVAKFEASGTTEDGTAVGNAEGGNIENVKEPDESTYVKVLPNVVSWRHISVGECQYQSMSMKDNKAAYGWSSIVDSHLIRNSEWGAVAYLCYSKYGSVPQKNGNGQKETYCYDMHTGAGPSANDVEESYATWDESQNGYISTLGQLASTTGNVYGIYDMSGGALEYVASFFNSTYVNTYGNSDVHDGSKIQYFDAETKNLNPVYSKYWELYEVNEEEKSGEIEIDDITLNYIDLWSRKYVGIEYEKKRYELTKELWNRQANKKGIGMNEIAGSWSYQGLVETGGLVWKTETTDVEQTYGKAWNSDDICVHSLNLPFMFRGGAYDIGVGTGIMRFFSSAGDPTHARNFRPVLAF